MNGLPPTLSDFTISHIFTFTASLKLDNPEYEALRDVLDQIDTHRADPLDLHHSGGSTDTDRAKAARTLLASTKGTRNTPSSSLGTPKKRPVYSTALADPSDPVLPSSERNKDSSRALDLARKDKDRRGDLQAVMSSVEDEEVVSKPKRRRGPAKAKSTVDTVGDMVEGSHRS